MTQTWTSSTLDLDDNDRLGLDIIDTNDDDDNSRLDDHSNRLDNHNDNESLDLAQTHTAWLQGASFIDQ
jgi:hypothetical protein